MTTEEKIKPGIYRHYKGNLYRVIGVAKKPHTEEEFVMYELLYENGWSRYAVRPLKEFMEKVEANGKLQPHFQFLESDRHVDEKKNWQVGIKGLAFNDEGKLLLAQEANGMWELPGGRIEHGETFHQTLKREIKEEMGVECEVLDKQPYWAWHHQMDDGRWKILLGYRIKLASFNFIKTDECVDSVFFSKQELIELGDKLYTNGIIGFL